MRAISRGAPKRWAVSILAAGFAAALPPAAAAQVTAPSCNFQPQLQTFSSRLSPAEGVSSDYLQQIRRELEARHKILHEVLDCAIADAKSNQAALAATPPTNPAAASVKARLLERFSQAIDYYAQKQNAIDDTGIRGSQDLSRAIREWRATVYIPIARNASNLALWIKDADLLAVADGRYNQISRTLSTLKLSSDDDAISALFANAGAHLSRAHDAHASAWGVLSILGSPDESLDDIKISLDNLSEAYQGFFDISSAVSKILTK